MLDYVLSLAAFPKDPAKNKEHENKIFRGLEQVFADITNILGIALCDSLTRSLASSRPDGYLLNLPIRLHAFLNLEAHQNAFHSWDDIAMPSEFKKKDALLEAEDGYLGVYTTFYAVTRVDALYLLSPSKSGRCAHVLPVALLWSSQSHSTLCRDLNC